MLTISGHQNIRLFRKNFLKQRDKPEIDLHSEYTP